MAGGCVRDLVLNIKPKDIDIATAAPPEKVSELFSDTVEVGQVFGVVRVVEDGQIIEVATFRKDGPYKDGRHPEEVVFSDAKTDADRRDFTMNAMFFDITKKEIIDYVGGVNDIHRQLIRTVGVPEKRFEEDHLRILRAIRFSAQLGFEIEKNTWAAVQTLAVKLSKVSAERIRDEILKILNSSHMLKGLVQLHESSALQVICPELFKSADNQFLSWMKLAGSGLNPLMAWSFFFWPLMKDSKDWNSFIQVADRFKITKDEKKSLKFAFDFIKKGKDWMRGRLGEKILFFASQEGPLLLQMQATLDSAWQGELQNLKSEFHQRAPDGALPQAFLSGNDVMHLIGKARGEKLLEAYELQIEGKLKNREEALAWLKI